MKSNHLTVLPEAQLEIMNIVWAKGEATVSEVWEEISQKRNVARNTIMTLMFRLEEKGWLKHRTITPTFIYSAARPRDKSSTAIISSVLDKVFGGSTENLVMTLLSHKNVSRKEMENVREAIKKAENKKLQR